MTYFPPLLSHYMLLLMTPPYMLLPLSIGPPPVWRDSGGACGWLSLSEMISIELPIGVSLTELYSIQSKPNFFLSHFLHPTLIIIFHMMPLLSLLPPMCHCWASTSIRN